MPSFAFAAALLLLVWFVVGLAIAVRREVQSSEARLAVSAAKGVGRVAGGMLAVLWFDMLVAALLVAAVVLGVA